MDPIRLFSIISWISLPTVMFGGYSLMRLLASGDKMLTPFTGAVLLIFPHFSYTVPVSMPPARNSYCGRDTSTGYSLTCALQ